MSPTPRAAIALAVVALLALVLPAPLIVVLAVLVVAAIVFDTLVARGELRLRRSLPNVLSRGRPAVMSVDATAASAGRIVVRQPVVPDLRITPSEGVGRLDAQVVGRRRGRHDLPPVAARREGPLGLGSWFFSGGERTEVLVYPDLPAARALAVVVRRGRFRQAGLHTRGPLGLGTEFESIRDYLPDDDVRQINWRATARVGRPMSNQYRVETDRDVVCLVDTGRLMGAPILGPDAVPFTRLDAAVDAVTAVAMVADELGDRCGVVAFDREVRRRVSPSRSGGDAVLHTIFDLEPRSVDSDYDLAFRSVGGSKRSLVLVLTDLVDEAAAQSLLHAVPVLARRHAVVIASVRDPDLDAAVHTPPRVARDTYSAAVALDVLDARSRVVVRLRHAGAEVVEAAPSRLNEACVGAYLRLKDRARL
ncbi:MAG: hypothetical protein QOI55_2301 [Actinomycetota bacterium]|nr:hypothetical protein [Actinomycetota bacterium]